MSDQDLNKVRFEGEDFPQGWISPKGEWHGVGDSDLHEHVIERLVGKAAKPHDMGWLSMGHAGSNNVSGSSKVLFDPTHPANKRARHALKVSGFKYPNVDIHETDTGTVHSIPMRHYAMHGTKPSKAALFRHKTFSLDLLKAPPLVYDDPKKPTKVYRVENKKGEGPYQHNDTMGLEWADNFWAHAGSPRRPVFNEDPGFTSKDKDEFHQEARNNKLGLGPKFGFHHKDEAERWFSPTELKRLEAHGFKLKAKKATKVWSSGKQAFYKSDYVPDDRVKRAIDKYVGWGSKDYWKPLQELHESGELKRHSDVSRKGLSWRGKHITMYRGLRISHLPVEQREEIASGKSGIDFLLSHPRHPGKRIHSFTMDPNHAAKFTESSDIDEQEPTNKGDVYGAVIKVRVPVSSVIHSHTAYDPISHKSKGSEHENVIYHSGGNIKIKPSDIFTLRSIRYRPYASYPEKKRDERALHERYLKLNEWASDKPVRSVVKSQSNEDHKYMEVNTDGRFGYAMDRKTEKLAKTFKIGNPHEGGWSLGHELTHRIKSALRRRRGTKRKGMFAGKASIRRIMNKNLNESGSDLITKAAHGLYLEKAFGLKIGGGFQSQKVPSLGSIKPAASVKAPGASVKAPSLGLKPPASAIKQPSIKVGNPKIGPSTPSIGPKTGGLTFTKAMKLKRKLKKIYGSDTGQGWNEGV